MADTKEWTLMFYFASDNPLAPSIVSQLKALKNAGFHPDANVVARFDPHTEGTPLHTFDINLFPKVEARAKLDALDKLKIDDNAKRVFKEKLCASGGHQVGFGNDPFVKNLVFDKLWGEETIPNSHDDGDEKIKDLIERQLKDHIKSFPKNDLSMKGLDLDHLGLSGLDLNALRLDDDEINELIKFDPPNPNPPAKTNGEGEPQKVAEDSADKGNVKRISERKDKPKKALKNFLRFCAKEYPAHHYMLFILGHGLIVGNDMFLFDEHAKKSSLSLKDLGETIDTFLENKKEGDLELIGFHSCSMSSIEVAYQLEGKAKYMLASQGPEFVGSWPYMQILMRVFNDLISANRTREPMDIGKTVTRIFQYCFFNSNDFQMAGYSFDLALCDLTTVSKMTPLIKNLTAKLKMALGDRDHNVEGDEFLRALILMAHWDAQSFWRDTYTDLYDFCLCLYNRCDAAAKYVSGETKDNLGKIQKDCVELMKKLLGKGDYQREDKVILHSGFAGPTYQYSHGLSVFFPWSEPGNEVFWPDEYRGYKFEETGWHDFLQRYFDNTMRNPRRDERGHDHPELLIPSGEAAGEDATVSTPTVSDDNSSLRDRLLEGITAHVLGGVESAQLGKSGGGDATGKSGGGDASGDDCDCPPIKNYPSATRTPRMKEDGTLEWSKQNYKTGTCLGIPKGNGS
jgi:hypothetical protein